LEEWDVSIDGVQEGRATPAGSGWEEGVYISNEDQATIQACNRMKANDALPLCFKAAPQVLTPSFLQRMPPNLTLRLIRLLRILLITSSA
jgi:hypothetical protein